MTTHSLTRDSSYLIYSSQITSHIRIKTGYEDSEFMYLNLSVSVRVCVYVRVCVRVRERGKEQFYRMLLQTMHLHICSALDGLYFTHIKSKTEREDILLV